MTSTIFELPLNCGIEIGIGNIVFVRGDGVFDLFEMYSDRVVAETVSKNTVKNRLNGGSGDLSSRGRQVTRKRGRQEDDKWEHDLFDVDTKPRLSNRKVDPRDLRLKLQKKHHGLQSRLGGASLGERDLREKLSGTKNPQPRNANLKTSTRVATRPAVKNGSDQSSSEQSCQEETTAGKMIPHFLQTIVLLSVLYAAGTSVDSFLESLGLEKYSTSFQVEEVDMDALMHMTDDDLKALLIPMGPRKKILLALGSKQSGFGAFGCLLAIYHTPEAALQTALALGIEQVVRSYMALEESGYLFSSTKLLDTFGSFLRFSHVIVIAIRDQ
ncbi:hypothetical protein HID58_077036 [Brassica napus]|uniref:SAM domain-containing protein n=1 Tax=Brassica napus TaxID=3708 RepID=A0ABQ7YQA0_BRANA|nr:hypothetical protein HID58_077036 [Brassica napus]